MATAPLGHHRCLAEGLWRSGSRFQIKEVQDSWEISCKRSTIWSPARIKALRTIPIFLRWSTSRMRHLMSNSDLRALRVFYHRTTPSMGNSSQRSAWKRTSWKWLESAWMIRRPIREDWMVTSSWPLTKWMCTQERGWPSLWLVIQTKTHQASCHNPRIQPLTRAKRKTIKSLLKQPNSWIRFC